MNISLYYNQFFNCNKPSACFWNTEFTRGKPHIPWDDNPLNILNIVTDGIPSVLASMPSWT